MTKEGIKILNMYLESNYQTARQNRDEIDELYSDGDLYRLAILASIIDYIQNRILDKLVTINANIETLIRRNNK